MGATGRGTHEHRGVFGKIDIITGTLGKALGGASGGFTAARREVVELLRQRSRPYLFSNTLAPAIAGARSRCSTCSRAAPRCATSWRTTRAGSARRSRRPASTSSRATHPIVPIMVYDAVKAQQLAARLLELGVYAVGFFFPVVPKGQARIRVQMSAVHEREHLERAVAAFAQAGRELGLRDDDRRRCSAKILIIGANGQIGTELAEALAAAPRRRRGRHQRPRAARPRAAACAHEALDVHRRRRAGRGRRAPPHHAGLPPGGGAVGAAARSTRCGPGT